MSEAQFEERPAEIAYLLVHVYKVHEVIIAETRGLLGLRGAAMLHAAVAHPFASFDGQDLTQLTASEVSRWHWSHS